MRKAFTATIMILAAMLLSGCSRFDAAPVKCGRTAGSILDDRALAIASSDDGGVAIAGTSSRNLQSGKAFIYRIGRNGKIQKRTISGERYSTSEARCIAQSSDGGFVAAGFTKKSLSSPKDIFVMKTDISGHSVWTETFGDIFDDEAAAITWIPQHGFLIAGSTVRQKTKRKQVWILLLDEKGGIVWNRIFNSQFNEAPVAIIKRGMNYSIVSISDSGGTNKSEFRNTVFDYSVGADGELIRKRKLFKSRFPINAVAGISGGGLLLAGDGVLMRIHESGGIAWLREVDADMRSAVETHSGDYLAAGVSKTFFRNRQSAFIARFTARGKLQWRKLVGGDGDYSATALNISGEKDFSVAGSMEKAGSTNEDAWYAIFKHDGTCAMK